MFTVTMFCICETFNKSLTFGYCFIFVKLYIFEVSEM